MRVFDEAINLSVTVTNPVYRDDTPTATRRSRIAQALQTLERKDMFRFTSFHTGIREQPSHHRRHFTVSDTAIFTQKLALYKKTWAKLSGHSIIYGESNRAT